MCEIAEIRHTAVCDIPTSPNLGARFPSSVIYLRSCVTAAAFCEVASALSWDRPLSLSLFHSLLPFLIVPPFR